MTACKEVIRKDRVLSAEVVPRDSTQYAVQRLKYPKLNIPSHYLPKEKKQDIKIIS